MIKRLHILRSLSAAATVLLFLLINGCTSGDPPMNADKLKEFATQYTAAWCSQNAASVSAFFAEDGVLSVNGSPAVGREAITAVAQGFMSAFPDMELIMDALEIPDDADPDGKPGSLICIS